MKTEDIQHILVRFWVPRFLPYLAIANKISSVLTVSVIYILTKVELLYQTMSCTVVADSSCLCAIQVPELLCTR